MSDEQNRHTGEEMQLDEDTEAILNRRRFLIRSALIGAGLGAAVSGCKYRCLSYVQPEPSESEPPTPDKPQQRPPEPGPDVCLSVYDPGP